MPSTVRHDYSVDPFADWLEDGQRFAGEYGPAAVESAFADTLTSAYSWWGDVLPPFGPERQE